MAKYLFWVFLNLFFAMAIPYSFLGIKEFSENLLLIGFGGTLLVIFTLLIAWLFGLMFSWIQSKLISNIIFSPIFILLIIGLLLTGAVSVVYPITSAIKIVSVVHSSIFNDSEYETDYDNQEGYDYDDQGGYDSDTQYNSPDTHHVDPHWVDGYERSDGTEVDGYWRGGDDGYERSNPDGDTGNNLDSGSYDTGGDTGGDWDWW